MKRILVPTDCSRASESALRLATQLSYKSNARVYILRVIKTHGGAYFDEEGEIIEDHATDVTRYRERKTLETARLNDWANRINPEAFQVVKYGGVADVILDTIEKYKISLVILGNRFTDADSTRFFGELTSHLIRRSKAPVLSVKTDGQPARLKHIVVANEFEGKLSYFDALQDLYKFCDAQVHLLRIYRPGKIVKEEIYEHMDYFARTNMIKDYTKNLHISERVESGILEWISDNPCDLLVVKNVSKRGSRLFRPKLSKRILKNEKVSTLIYND